MMKARVIASRRAIAVGRGPALLFVVLRREPHSTRATPFDGSTVPSSGTSGIASESRGERVAVRTEVDITLSMMFRG